MSTLEGESDGLPAGKLLYTAKVHTTGGRERGVARSCDGNLDIRLSTPGAGGSGSNPEQLLAAGWSACFAGAIDLAARKNRITLPDDLTIDAEIELNLSEIGRASCRERVCQYV